MNVQALRRKGVDARLLVFRPQPWRPGEHDESLHLAGKSLARRQLAQWRALARYLPRTDIFHFDSCETLVPKKFQFPILRATRKKCVMHFLGDDIRGKTRDELAYGRRAGLQIVGSYAATRWVPEAVVVPPGIDLREYAPVTPVERDRPLVVHAPSNLESKGTRFVIEACEAAPRRPRCRTRCAARGGDRAVQASRHRRRPDALSLARRLRDRVHGVWEAGRDVPGSRGRPPDRRRRSGWPCRSCPRRRRISSSSSSRSSNRSKSAADSAKPAERTSSDVPRHRQDRRTG